VRARAHRVPGRQSHGAALRRGAHSSVTRSLHEFTKFVTTARDKSFWYMFEPLLISKGLYDSLTPEQQKYLASWDLGT